MKNAYKSAADKLKGSFTLVEAIKRNLRNELDRINADKWTSNGRKTQLCDEAISAARSQLESVRATADAAAVDLATAANALVNHLNYNDQQLIGAINFVNSFGKDTPREAADQIIGDFKEQPAALKLLKKTFDKSGLGEASIKAAEELTRFSGLDTIAQRVGDSIYYSTTGDITAPANSDSFITEIDGVSAALGIGSEGTGS